MIVLRASCSRTYFNIDYMFPPSVRLKSCPYSTRNSPSCTRSSTLPFLPLRQHEAASLPATPHRKIPLVTAGSCRRTTHSITNPPCSFVEHATSGTSASSLVLILLSNPLHHLRPVFHRRLAAVQARVSNPEQKFVILGKNSDVV